MTRRTLNQPATPAFSTNVVASRAPEDRVTIGGQEDGGSQWSHLLTKRAAKGLWFDLTRILYPEKSDEVLGQVTTIPSLPPNRPGEEELTTWTFVTQKPDSSCEIVGWVGQPGWSVRVNAHEMYRFWASLDTVLFPAGWQF